MYICVNFVCFGFSEMSAASHKQFSGNSGFLFTWIRSGLGGPLALSAQDELHASTGGTYSWNGLLSLDVLEDNLSQMSFVAEAFTHLNPTWEIAAIL